MIHAINIKTIDKPGVLRKVTDFLAKENINIVYTHMFKDATGYAHMYIELEDVNNIENVLRRVTTILKKSIKSINHHLRIMYGEKEL